ncbi:MAG: hypothetical protein NTU83_00960 [Candidatus Hydrogenedentes bacterium]|nr:hypothetical protein [Candidatus Hydrogenedentota bacterium]
MARVAVFRCLGLAACVALVVAFGGCKPQPAQKAALQVTLSPADVVTAGAEWQIEYGDW